MSEPTQEQLEHVQESVDEARAAARDAPVFPVGDDDEAPSTPDTPEESGGAVAEHGDGQDIDEEGHA